MSAALRSTYSPTTNPRTIATTQGTAIPGSFSRQRRITRSTSGSSPETWLAKLVGVVSSYGRTTSRSVSASKARWPVNDS